MSSKFIVRSILAAITAVSPLMMSACAVDGAPAVNQGDFGTLQMALRGTSSSTGLFYRLRNAVIAVTGPTVDVYQTETDPDSSWAEFNLPPGDYEILVTGVDGADTWYLERQTGDGTYEQVDATLLTPNPLVRSVESGVVAGYALQFVLDGDEVVLEPGALVISFNVIDDAQCEFTEVDPGCQANQKCSPISAEIAICEPAGTVPQGGACVSNADCALGSCWGGDWGCRNPCIPDVPAGAPGSCLGGGICSHLVNVDGDVGYGVCVP